jgi:hypothetical protein
LTILAQARQLLLNQTVQVIGEGVANVYVVKTDQRSPEQTC